MRVFKFGGASVKSAEAVKNVSKVLTEHGDGPLVVVISAMGKITNKMEQLVDAYFLNKDSKNKILDEIKDYDIYVYSAHSIVIEKINELETKILETNN